MEDFNGDGNPDLAVVNAGSNSVSILLGNGDGTFQASQSYTVGSYPYSIAVADFNGDGKPDLAVSDFYSSTVSILLGNGDGTFQASQSYAAGNYPYSVAVADFNGDGKPDLAVSNLYNNTASVLLGNGDGTFQAYQSYATGTYPYSIAVGDFNGDGAPDLATANANDNTTSALLNVWSVQATASNVFVLGGSGTHAVFGAYGGDAKYAPSNSSTVSLFGGVSTALALTASPGTKVQAGQTVKLTATVTPNSYNGLTASGTVTFYDGTNQIGSPQNLDSSGKASFTTGGLTVGNHSFTALYSGDNTFAAATGAVLVSAYLGSTTTLSVSSQSVSAGTAVVFTATVVDQNSAPVTTGQVTFCDATATYCEDIAVLGTAQLTSTGKAALTVRLGVGSHSVTAVFSGNAVDAGSVSNNQSVTVTGQTTASSLSVTGVVGNYTLTTMVTGGGSSAPTGTVTFEDASNGNATVATAALDAKTAVAGFPLTGYGVGSYPYGVAVGDFNGDGKPDLVVTNEGSSSVSVLLGNGDGTYQTQVAYTTGNCPYGVAVADVNGDGKQDLVVANSCSSTISVLLGNGDGTFQVQQAYPAGYGTYSVAVGDFNGDGKPDLVVGNYYNSTVSVLLGNGDGTFQPLQTYAAGNSPLCGGGGRFQRGWKIGLGGGQLGDNTVASLLGNGDGTFQTQVTYAPGSIPLRVAVGDFNGDGKLDLAV